MYDKSTLMMTDEARLTAAIAGCQSEGRRRRQLDDRVSTGNLNGGAKSG